MSVVTAIVWLCASHLAIAYPGEDLDLAKGWRCVEEWDSLNHQIESIRESIVLTKILVSATDAEAEAVHEAELEALIASRQSLDHQLERKFAQCMDISTRIEQARAVQAR